MSSQNPTRKQLLPYPPSRPSQQKVTEKNTTNDLENGGTASTANWGQQQDQVKPIIDSIWQKTKNIFVVNPKPNWPKWKCNWVFQNVSTPGQYNILNKNLNFCPTPYYYNKKLLKDNMCTFHKKITFKSVFILRIYFWKHIRRPRTTYKQLIWLGTKKKKNITQCRSLLNQLIMLTRLIQRKRNFQLII